MATHRIEKVSAQLMREISQLIHEDFGEEYGLITVSDIYVTPDFKSAKVYITVFEQERSEVILKSLTQKSYQYQEALGRKLKMKFTPQLTFIIDTGQEKIDRVEELLKKAGHGA